MRLLTFHDGGAATNKISIISRPQQRDARVHHTTLTHTEESYSDWVWFELYFKRQRQMAQHAYFDGVSKFN